MQQQSPETSGALCKARPMDGLTPQEAAARAAAGLANEAPKPLTKTAGRIVRDNLCTFFNFVFLALAACCVAVGAYRDTLFLGIVVINALIGIVQELRVKHTLDSIALLEQRPVQAVRGGEVTDVPPHELVLGDIVVLSAGCQVPADAELCTGEAEVNEALLTGEADNVRKRPGDRLLSGSFLSAGQCRARLTAVGKDCWAARLSQEAKRDKKQRSAIMSALDGWLKLVGLFIVPLGAAMLVRQLTLDGATFRYAVTSTVAALVGMIPEGLYLLTSIALALGVLRLARQRTLAHELSCIEALARIDTLCIDKTGTITTGNMRLAQVCPAAGQPPEAAREALAAFAAVQTSQNATACALRAALPGAPHWAVVREVPFSSERKYSALVLANGQCWALGAPEKVLGAPCEDEAVHGFLRQGLRVLCLARAGGAGEDGALLGPVQPVCWAVLRDELRPDAQTTLAYFEQQGVTVKVISGDNAQSAARVAQSAGIAGAQNFLDCAALPEEADFGPYCEATAVFGRVSPRHKQAIIRALQEKGHRVAMVGDGVNDVLALKQADCSVAMAGGSDAAGQTAQLVLLDAQFSAMPHIVREGRRVIANISRSASLFLVKNIFSFFLSAILLVWAMPYPLLPGQISLISGVLIGLPSFLLTFERSDVRAKGHFLRGALLNALPGGLCGTLFLLGTSVSGRALGLPQGQISSVCTLLAGVTGLCVVFFLCWPLTKLRAAVMALTAACFYGATAFFPWMFSIETLSARAWALTCGLGAAVPLVMSCLVFAVSFVKRRLAKKEEIPYGSVRPDPGI